jgi:HSP20 family molecular chaperone IbpA
MATSTEEHLYAPHLVMRKVVRDVDSGPAGGAAPAIEALRYSVGEYPWVPELEVFEDHGRIAIHVDLPGVTPADVFVSVTGDRLDVVGQRRKPSAARKDLHVPEPTYGRFKRTVRLPDDVQIEAMTWAFENGVFQITIPLAGERAAYEGDLREPFGRVG